MKLKYCLRCRRFYRLLPKILLLKVQNFILQLALLKLKILNRYWKWRFFRAYRKMVRVKRDE